MRKSNPSFTFASMDTSKLGYLFLYIDLTIGDNLTSSWKKSGQQTAFNHTSGRQTLNKNALFPMGHGDSWCI